MIIEVTQQHINDGIKWEASFCPLALAVKEKGYENVIVDYNSITITDNGIKFVYLMETPVIMWVSEFDNDKILPCKFDLEIVEYNKGEAKMVGVDYVCSSYILYI